MIKIFGIYQAGLAITPVVMGDNGAERSWRPVDHFVRAGQ